MKTLVPVLEECILKGRLRLLDVVVRDKDVGSGEGGNWDALRRVLGDRDLEVGRLLALAKVDEMNEDLSYEWGTSGVTDITERL